MTLRERYERDLARCDFVQDPAQLEVLAALELLAQQLSSPHRDKLWQRLANRFRPGPAHHSPLRGLYIWGGVGRGKTYLMDLFFEQLPVSAKTRSHFHRFMHTVHARLKGLAGQRNPLVAVAGQLAADTRVLCFDEFFVTDITDAMILGNLLRALFHRGVTLVATSNLPPDRLYEGGLQHERFLPAIGLIEAHTRVIHLDGALDYRLRLLERAEIYHAPLDEAAEENLNGYFEQIAPEPGVRDHLLEVEGRLIPTRRCADGVVWFEFTAICGGPRSQTDYIEISRCYQTVLISGVPALTPELADESRRFIALVDEFYDRNVKLILSAGVPLEELYQGQRLAFEFKRTRSRLEEMQSHDYLARPHLA